MSEGPTTVGSINAKLTLDYSEFMAKIAEADAAARKLGSVDPNVKIGADTAAADSKIAATAAAAKKLGASSPNIRVSTDAGGVAAKLAAVETATRKLALASEATRLSYLRLDAIQTKEGVSALQIAAAHLAASRAEETEKSATERLAAAKVALAAAEEAAAHAGDDADKTAEKLKNTNQSSVGVWALLTSAIVAAIAALGPLTAYAVGVSGALAGMGAAGALAVYGIIKAIKDATVTGEAYKSGLASLKTALDSLGNTAANAMLGSFKQAVTLINAALPNLNAQINTFGRILGNVGTSVLASVISALRILNPLFVEASAYVLQLARGFQSWIQGGGLQKFTDYARTQLPLVANMLNQLVQAALRIVVALAPLGTVVVQGITLLGAAINALPLPVLLSIATAAATGFAAFKVWSAIQPIMSAVATSIGAVGVATQLAEGPIGWITAGISAVAGAFAGMALSSMQATQGAIDFANALQQDNDKIAENVRLTAVKKLHDDGTIAAGHLLGLTTRQMTEAAVGNAGAMADVNSALAETQKRLASTGAATGEGTKKQNDQYKALRTVKQGLSDVNDQLDQGKVRQQEVKDATAGANDTYVTNADLLSAMKDATDQAAQATDALAKALAGVGQVNISEAQANIAYQQSLADATAALKQNGATLDENTQKGRDNMTALIGIANNAITLVAAHAKAGKSTQELTNDMAAARQSFIETAIKMGATAAQANALADQYGLIPKNVTTAVAASGVDEARQKIQDLQTWINNLHGKTVQIVANVTQAGTAGHLQAFAAGGTIPGLAGGGPGGGTVMGAGNAFTDTAGVYRLANGEEVVSNMYGQASMWRSALKLMNSGADRLKVASAVSRIAGVGPSHAGPPVSVHISSNGIDLSKYIDVRVMQGGQQIFAQANQQLNGGLA